MLPIGAGEKLRDEYQDFGTKRTRGGLTYTHKGVDISGGDGKSYTVLSPVAGVVVYAKSSPTFWPAVLVIQTGAGVFHRFGHLAPDSLLPVGSVVGPFSPLGRTSSNEENRRYAQAHGIDTMGAHVHYEITTDGPLPNPDSWPAGYRDPAYFLKTGLYTSRRASGRKYPMRFKP